MLYVFLALALLSGCALTYAASGFASLAAVWQVPVFFLGSFLALVVLFLLVVLVSCLFVDPKKLLEKPSGYFRFLLNEFCRLALALGGVHVNVTGLEKVPRDSRFLLVSNHRFAFDPLVFYSSMPWADLAFLSKKENFSIFVVAQIMREVLCLPVDRNNDRESLKSILKAIQFLLSSNLGEVLLIFVATVLNLGSPLLPIHILWVNLITDSLPALALGMEPAEPDVMDLPPRDPRSPIFTRPLLLRVIYQGLMIAGLSLAAYLTGARVSPDTGHTMAFAVLAFSQLAHAFNVRSNTHSAFMRGKMNRWMIPAFLSGVALQLCVLLVPFLQGLFHVAALTPAQWGLVALLSLMPLPIVEMLKALGLTGESRTKR